MCHCVSAKGLATFQPESSVTTTRSAHEAAAGLLVTPVHPTANVVRLDAAG